MPQVLQQQIHNYWEQRADTYSLVNQEELAGDGKDLWWQELSQQINDQLGPHLPAMTRVLDIGTGPGFFAILFARAGYQVTALDASAQMIAEAKKNAGDAADMIQFEQMDAQAPLLPENSYDIIVSRNLTWVLPEPELAYQNWTRLLSPGGLMLNFDANWYAHLYDPQKRLQYQNDRKNVERLGQNDHYIGTNIEWMEEIAAAVPLTARLRPEWDLAVLGAMNGEVTADDTVWERVWSVEENINYHSTPMFLISFRKGDTTL